MFRRILLAIDGTKSAAVAVDFATAIGRDLGASVRVVHVNELIVGGRGFAHESESEAMEIVDRAVGVLRSGGVSADGVHYLANCFVVGERIAEAARDWGADAIVFGSKRRGRLSRFRGAGLRERVTALTGLPVLTAPSPLKVPRGIDGDALDRELAQLAAASPGD
jgi:nucleotide-binding universal stress UspA family protein